MTRSLNRASRIQKVSSRATRGTCFFSSLFPNLSTFKLANVRTLFLSLLPYLLASLGPSSASAQVATGTPPFGSFGGGPDIINLANLNAHIAIPVLHKPGRGTNFTYDLSYDSSVWYPVTSGGTKSWQPVLNFGWRGVTEISVGYVTFNAFTWTCIEPDTGNHLSVTTYDSWVYHDPFGVAHFFQNAVLYGGQWLRCGLTEVRTDTAVDGSGYQIVASTTNPSVINPGGATFNPPVNNTTGAASFVDRNGNQITVNSSGQFFDTLSSTAQVLTVSGSGTPKSPITFTYTAPSGASASYKMNYTNCTVATNFGNSTISEYKSSAAVPLVTSIVLPDNSQYTFTYEPTPSTAPQGACSPYAGTSCVTARLASVILPTGGSINYSYSGGNNGILSDGSTATLTRTTPDGTWTYAQVKGTGAASTTTITAPQLPYDSAANQTVIQFQGIYETQRQIYQGSTSGTLLSTVNTCYNGAAYPCTGTAITPPINQRTTNATIQGPGNLQSLHTDKFDNFGNLTESDDYDFAAAAPFPLLRQTLITYASLGNYLNAFRQTVTVKDGNGNIKFRQDTNYDQYTSFTGSNCITGAPQHDDTGHGCSFTARANATSTTNYTDPVTPGGAITKNFTYDSLGNLRTSQLNCCQLKTFNYSATTKYAYPDSVVSGSSSPQMTTSATYDLNMGLILTTTDPNNLQTALTYDNLGRPLTAKTGTNPATNYTYNDYDNHASFTPWTVQICSPVQGTNTACQKSFLDKLGRTATAQMLDGNSTLYSAFDTQYDPLGRAYKTSNPYTGSAAYWTQVNFDALGRLLKTTLPDSSVSTVSYTDNSVTGADPVGKQRKNVFDGLGRLTSVWEPDSSNNLTLQTSYTYNVLDELTQISQGVQTRTYVYDALGRLLSATTPEAGRVCFGTVTGSTCNTDGYDSFDNLKYKTDARGVLTSYGYDGLNRLNSVSYNVGVTGVPATSTISLTYGLDSSCTSAHGAGCIGQLITMTDGPGSENYTYNSLEQLTQLDKVISGTIYTTKYAYNLADELSQITYPSNRAVAQNLDTIGRLSSIVGTLNSVNTTYAGGFGYNAAQQTTGFQYGNNLYASFGFYPDTLLLKCLDYSPTNRNGTCTNDSTTKFGLQYNYPASPNNNGQISSITDNVDNGRTATYTYDALYRLTRAVTTGSANYPAWGLSETYDRYGNRSTQSIYSGCSGITCPTNSVTPDTATNRITGDCYDANGNLLAESSAPCPSPTYSYDAENHLVSYSTSATYTYDGNGHRVKKVSGGVTTIYIFSGSKVIAEYSGTSAPYPLAREYIYSGAMLLAKIEGGATMYYHADHLSNRLLTDSSGNTLGQRGHYPFGETWYESGTTTKIQFTSYERDSESGNDYAMARYYMSRLGRFSSPDPLSGSTANPQSLNRYEYVLDDPVQLADASGLCGKRAIELVGYDPCGRDAVVGGGDDNCWVVIDGGQAPCSLAGSGEANINCPNNDCSIFNQPQTGANGLQYWILPGVNGYEYINVLNGDEVENSDELGLPEQDPFGPALGPGFLGGNGTSGEKLIDPWKALAECVKKLFGVTEQSFVPSESGKFGSFTGTLPNGNQFTVTNDARTYSTKALTWRFAPLTAILGGSIYGYTNGLSPYKNYTANDLSTPEVTTAFQIHELGHSLAAIAFKNPFARESWGDKLLDCVAPVGKK